MTRHHLQYSTLATILIVSLLGCTIFERKQADIASDVDPPKGTTMSLVKKTKLSAKCKGGGHFVVLCLPTTKHDKQLKVVTKKPSKKAYFRYPCKDIRTLRWRTEDNERFLIRCDDEPWHAMYVVENTDRVFFDTQTYKDAQPGKLPTWTNFAAKNHLSRSIWMTILAQSSQQRFEFLKAISTTKAPPAGSALYGKNNWVDRWIATARDLDEAHQNQLRTHMMKLYQQTKTYAVAERALGLMESISDKDIKRCPIIYDQVLKTYPKRYNDLEESRLAQCAALNPSPTLLQKTCEHYKHIPKFAKDSPMHLYLLGHNKHTCATNLWPKIRLPSCEKLWCDGALCTKEALQIRHQKHAQTLKKYIYNKGALDRYFKQQNDATLLMQAMAAQGQYDELKARYLVSQYKQSPAPQKCEHTTKPQTACTASTHHLNQLCTMLPHEKHFKGPFFTLDIDRKTQTLKNVRRASTKVIRDVRGPYNQYIQSQWVAKHAQQPRPIIAVDLSPFDAVRYCTIDKNRNASCPDHPKPIGQVKSIICNRKRHTQRCAVLHTNGTLSEHTMRRSGGSIDADKDYKTQVIQTPKNMKHLADNLTFDHQRTLCVALANNEIWCRKSSDDTLRRITKTTQPITHLVVNDEGQHCHKTAQSLTCSEPKIHQALQKMVGADDEIIDLNARDMICVLTQKRLVHCWHKGQSFPQLLSNADKLFFEFDNSADGSRKYRTCALVGGKRTCQASASNKKIVNTRLVPRKWKTTYKPKTRLFKKLKTRFGK